MFGTLRYEPQRSGTEFVQGANAAHFHDVGGFVSQHSACDTCRSKKVKSLARCALHAIPGGYFWLWTDLFLQLRCSGQKPGCDRCKSTSSPCIYSEVVDGRGTRRRKRPEAHSTGQTNPSSTRPSTRAQEASTARGEQGVKASAEQSSARKTTRQENDVSDPIIVSTDDNMFDRMQSPMRSFEEDSVISDQMLRDIMPDYDSEGVNFNEMMAADSTLPMDFEDDGYLSFSPTDANSSSVSCDLLQSTAFPWKSHQSMNQELILSSLQVDQASLP